MPSEKKNVMLKPTEYDISGNSIRAFYDNQGKLVFVLDLTITDTKPNVLLVMSSYGNRKWDDVLANDYGMNLELVRPKKDNKYQKLDVEYDKLAVYDNLISASKSGNGLKKVLQELADFRLMAAYNSANERLTAARVVAENAQETIERTGDSIVELQAKIKSVRVKIAGLRRGVGREPTKESAAKILKAEAQLDALNDKLARAQKRLENANKRLLTAQDDIDAAQSVLDLLPNMSDKKNNMVVAAPVANLQDMNDEKGDDVADDDEQDLLQEPEYGADESDVKPLFDKDPNILDDNIAFKPIDFGDVSVEDSGYDENVPDDQSGVDIDDDVNEPERVDEVSDVSTDEEKEKHVPAIEFEPPRDITDAVKLPASYETEDDDKLDSVFSEGLDGDVKYDTAAPEVLNNAQHSNQVDEQDAEDNASVLNSLQSVSQTQTGFDANNSSQIFNLENKEPEIIAAEGSMDGLAENNADSIASTVVSPVSGISSQVRPMIPGTAPSVVAEIPKQTTNVQHKPGFLYYVLLLVLIALSVFTLWLYQRSNISDNVLPTLVTDDAPVVEQSDAVKDENVVDDSNPFVASGEDIVENKKPMLEKVVEDSLNKVAEVSDVPQVGSAKDEMTGVETEEFVEKSEEIQDESVVPSAEKAPVVNKPEYNVSQDDVFVDATQDEQNLCDGGIAPDADGCCPGETYLIENGQGVCCPDGGTDCYPPIIIQ
ncbi:MAG: hypothetical protein KBT14_02990 [Proteobacteria bacterium]|nr:hypothetical protein [Candidatus Enterousia onthequi]